MAKKSEALAKCVRNFYAEGKDLFIGMDLVSHGGEQWDSDAVEVCVCEGECSCAELEELPMGRIIFDTLSDDLAPLPLPSSFDALPEGWEDVAQTEVGLRVAQAEEALEALRGEIAHKSCLYRGKRELGGGGRGVTRSYDEINGVESRMCSHVKVYKSACWALDRLGVSAQYPRFLPLNRSHTKAVTAVFDPNRPGERNTELSWIWTMHVQAHSPNKEYLVECEFFLQLEVNMSSFLLLIFVSASASHELDSRAIANGPMDGRSSPAGSGDEVVCKLHVISPESLGGMGSSGSWRRSQGVRFTRGG